MLVTTGSGPDKLCERIAAQQHRFDDVFFHAAAVHASIGDSFSSHQSGVLGCFFRVPSGSKAEMMQRQLEICAADDSYTAVNRGDRHRRLIADNVSAGRLRNLKELANVPALSPVLTTALSDGPRHRPTIRITVRVHWFRSVEEGS